MAFKIFIKFVLPILLVFGLCITAYFVLTKPTEVMVNSTESRIQDVKNYEQALSNSRIDAIANEKTTFYILIFGIAGILFIFGFHLLKLILMIDTNYLLYPNKYSVVPIEEEDCLRYIKDKFMEANIIKNNQLLEKEHVIKMLSNNLPPKNY